MRAPRVLGWLGVALTVAAITLLLTLPMYAGTSVGASASVGPDGQLGPVVTTPETVTHATLLEVNGSAVLIPLGLLLLFAVVAVWGRPLWVRWIGVALFGALTVLGALSVGAFFVPALPCLLLAVALSTPERSADARTQGAARKAASRLS